MVAYYHFRSQNLTFFFFLFRRTSIVIFVDTESKNTFANQSRVTILSPKCLFLGRDKWLVRLLYQLRTPDPTSSRYILTKTS